MMGSRAALTEALLRSVTTH